MMTVYDFIQICEACEIDTSKLRAAVYIIERTNPETLEFKISYDDIARGVGVSYATAAKIMKLFQSSGMIIPVSRGVWKWSQKIFDLATDDELLNPGFTFLVKNYLSA